MTISQGRVSFYTSRASHGPTRLAYESWGPTNGCKIICVHGLTCNRHDFAVLAHALAQDGYHVISVDLAGRGDSDTLPNSADYTHAQYADDLVALFEHLKISEDEKIDYIGTSLGGLIGFDLASRPNTPIARLILNDIGPEVPIDALNFIKAVIKQQYFFPDVEALFTFMKQMRGPSYGIVTDEQWRFIAEKYARTTTDGRITYHYDPRIAEMFDLAPIGKTDLWHCWDMITQPTLAIRGANSLVFPQDILERMKKQNLQSVVLPDCGHVPSLMHSSQIDLIRNWLSQTQGPNHELLKP